ncbi:TPA: hypothetical protein ACPZHP_001349 [Yersinia enterocolitica]
MSEIKQYDTEVRLEAVMGTNHYGVHIHAMTTEDLHSKSGIAVELAWRDLRIEQLIAQLESAQKERDALREVHIGAGSNTRAAADIYFQLVEELEVPAGGSLVGVIDNLKAELSAANEKLKGEQVPVAVIVLSKNWPDTGRKVIDYYIEKIQHLPVGTELFTALQKPVVLSSSTVMSRAYVVQAIKAAGFTVEGE